MTLMTSPPSGVKIRMYRQGHGDCFLLAFAGRDGSKKRTVYVLIDCGLKPNSEVHSQKIDKIIDDIREATDGHVDVVIATHEHQDHVNGFAKKKLGKHLFDKIKFGQCWLAWTEDGDDAFANQLRETFKDTLVTLAFAQEKVTALKGNSALAARLSDLLDTELGDPNQPANLGHEGRVLTNTIRALQDELPHMGLSELAAQSIKGITNKKAMKYLRNRAQNPTVFLRPDGAPSSLPYVKDLKIYTLGPPRNVDLLKDLDPVGREEFHLNAAAGGLALSGEALGFAKAVLPDQNENGNSSPFSARYCLKKHDVFAHILPQGTNLKPTALDYLREVYGGNDPEPQTAWRRIDDDWLGAAEGLALRLNNEVNNTSLVLMFELPKTGKTLLFTGDAQRGNWIGWSELEWSKKEGSTVTAKDLLARCVLYKCGHHGSHNATLNGTEDDDHANIGWMARGTFADDFVAMIPANTAWATKKTRPWAHPLPEIEKALQKKARGRVFRTDRDHVEQPDLSVLSKANWQAFQRRTKETDLYFEYTVEDK